MNPVAIAVLAALVILWLASAAVAGWWTARRRAQRRERALPPRAARLGSHPVLPQLPVRTGSHRPGAEYSALLEGIGLKDGAQAARRLEGYDAVRAEMERWRAVAVTVLLFSRGPNGHSAVQPVRAIEAPERPYEINDPDHPFRLPTTFILDARTLALADQMELIDLHRPTVDLHSPTSPYGVQYRLQRRGA